MKEGQRLWSREELILAINLYSKLTFGQMSQGNGAIIDLAELIDRTPASVAYKLVNFASLDPQLKRRGIKGMSNASKLDKAVWQEYMQNWDEQYIEGENLLASKKHSTIDKLYNINLDDLKTVEGKERERKVKVRINQHLFRGIVLSNYNNQCCITGINIPELIVASHILPWSKDEGNRLNPKNGLALNSLHDKAFDCGLLTVTEDLIVKISPKLLRSKDIESINQNFIQYDGKQLIKPKKFYPDAEFLKVHNERFQA
jgi:putative restriction endonuclease